MSQDAIISVQMYYIHAHVLMREEKEGRKKQAWSNKQQDKETQHPKKNELPRVGLESTYVLERRMCMYMYMYVRTILSRVQSVVVSNPT